MLQRKKLGNFKPKGRQVKIEAIKELNKIIGNNNDLRRDMLIEYLHLIQDANGYISSDLMEGLSNEMKLPLVEVWEVASFYDHFDLIKEKIEIDANININIFEESGIKVLNGRYGPYVTNGKVNVTVPKDIKPESLNEEQCVEMIKNAPPKRRGRRRFRPKAS